MGRKIDKYCSIVVWKCGVSGRGWSGGGVVECWCGGSGMVEWW